MKRIMWNNPRLLTLGLAVVVLLIGFQNCAQPGDVGIVQNPESVVNDAGRTVLPEYSETSLSSRPPPPLKLVFVMDNSNSMTLNNLNLQKSFSSMFSGNQDSLSQFDIDISFVTTAQVAELATGFLPSMVSIHSLAGTSPSDVQKNFREPNVFSGLIPGDLLGFRQNKVKNDNIERREFLPQSVLDFRSPSNNSDPAIMSETLPAIQFRRGQSVEELAKKVASHLEIISPKLASAITNPSVFPVIDTSSGLCALGRILKHSKSFFNKGDVVSFVLVSDHDEFTNPDGSQCKDSIEREYLYNVSCNKTTAASVIKKTRINYISAETPESVSTNLSITRNDEIRPKKITTLTLSKAAQSATCSGTQEREFNAKYEVINNTYFITYTKKPWLGVREGGVQIYGAMQSGLKTSNIAGIVPASCPTNLALLKTILGDTTSELAITSCTQNAATTSNETKTFTYAAHPSVDLSVSTACSSALTSAINPTGALTLGACYLVSKVEAIPSSSLSSKGFGSSSTQVICQAAIASVCADSGGSIRKCSFSSFSASTPSVTRGPVSVTQNSALNCSATCATFPDLCLSNDGTSISAFATSQGLVCIPAISDSHETYTHTFSPYTATGTSSAALSCSSVCSSLPSACPGGSLGSTAISSVNKSCSFLSSGVNPATPGTSRSFDAFIDSTQSITCDSPCSSTVGVCSGAQLIKDYIASISGTSCTETRLTIDVPGTSVTTPLTRKTKAEITAGNYCDAGFTPVPGTLAMSSSDYVETSTLVSSGFPGLKEFILAQMKTQIGERAGTLSTFITGEKDSKPAMAITYGALYEDLVKSWGHGSVNDIHSDSYSPALSELGSTLRDQLIRTVNFPSVTSPEVRIRKVWIRTHGSVDWGRELSAELWSASGGSVTLDLTVPVNANDEVKVQYY
ncbi:MAG: VWA domain-containing protein [Bdellovibrionaceae bacterium]|nr:VWA domain-containing protein [Pseudobdellovibrionaceae bacterium]